MVISGGIKHLPKEQQENILNTKTVPQHKCCVDPYWLYRIYQDTVAHPQELSDLISKALEASRAHLSFIKSHEAEYTEVLPPVINADDFECMDGENRKPGDLWIKWKEPWTGEKAELWVVQILNDGKLYSSPYPTVAIPGFTPGSSVHFKVKGKFNGKEHTFGRPSFCKL